MHKSPLQLRHMIYNHPQCVDEIVRWLHRVVAPERPGTVTAFRELQ